MIQFLLSFLIGVATQIKEIQPKAIYIWCEGHCTSLAACDCIKNVVILRNSLGTSKEILKGILNSPKRTIMLKNIKIEDLDTSVPGLTSFCATRWTVRAKSLNSIKLNYKTILKVWDESLEDGISDTDLRAKIIGLQHSMSTSYFKHTFLT